MFILSQAHFRNFCKIKWLLFISLSSIGRRFEIATEVSFENEKEQRFPVVTICNLNPLQKTKIENSGEDELKKLFDHFRYPGDLSPEEVAELFGTDFEEQVQLTEHFNVVFVVIIILFLVAA